MKCSSHSRDLFYHSDIKRTEEQRQETLLCPFKCSGQFLVILLHLGAHSMNTTFYWFIATADPLKVRSLWKSWPRVWIRCRASSGSPHQVFSTCVARESKDVMLDCSWDQVQTGLREAQTGNVQKKEEKNGNTKTNKRHFLICQIMRAQDSQTS